MGNPASPSLASLVMNYVINEITDKLDFKLPFFKLYVDDSITAIPKSKLNTILTTFNSFNKRIQFTMEVEENSKLPFLDILLIKKENGNILTSWYNKPTSSGRILNYLSNHPSYQKNNTVNNLIEKCINLTSSEFIEENLKKVKLILRDNNYPRKYINKLINKMVHRYKKNIRNNNNKNTDNVYCKLPYIEQLSYKLQRIFAQENCKTVFYNLKTTKDLFSKIKDQDNINNRSHVIYKIKCKDCNCLYIGQTKQLLDNRLKQHKYDCKITNINKENKTALSTHHFDNNHGFDFDGCQILDYENDWNKRNISEMIYIVLNDDVCVNHRTDTANLSNIYKGILHNYKSIQNML